MIKKFVAALFSLGLSAGAALAQSGCPTITNGAVLTAGQWNACFALKQNTLGYVPLNTAGGTMTGKLVTAASTTLTAGFNIPQGTAPTSPINGDMWSTSGGFFGRAGGVTYGPFVSAGAGTFAATLPLAVSFPSGVVTFALNYNSSFALSGSNLALAAHGVSNANLRQSSAISVIGNAGVVVGDVADITASGAYQAFRVDSTGSSIGFGALDVSQANAVTGQLRAGSFPILTGAISTAGGSLTTTLVTAQPDAHTWAAVQTFTVAPVFTNQSGSRTALGLGTISTQNANAVAITGGTIAGLTGLAVRDTSAAFDLTFAATSSTPLSAGRALTFDVVNGARTIKIGSNLTVASDPGAVTGALKSNSTGTFAQAAASDLSNGSSGSGAVCLVTSCSMTTPIVAGGSITGLTTFALRDTSAAFDVTLAATSSSALSAGRTLTFNMGNVAHTLAFGTTANTITFPNLASFTVITNGDTGTVTNTMLAGSIAASKLVGTDITTVGALAAGSATTGFTIAASNVTWTGAVPIANLPVGTNAAKGIVQCDNTTITCTSGVITAIGASAASIDAGGATSISNGTTGALLFQNGSGKVDKTLNPTTLTGATMTANSLTTLILQDATSSQDKLTLGASTSGGWAGAGPGAVIQYTPNAESVLSMLTIQSPRTVLISATSSDTNTTLNPKLWVGNSACCVLPAGTIPGFLLEAGNQQNIAYPAVGPGPMTVNILSKSKNTGAGARDVRLYLWGFESSPGLGQSTIANWAAAGTYDAPTALKAGSTVWELGGFAYCGTYNYCINYAGAVRVMLESDAIGTTSGNASSPGNFLMFTMRDGANDMTIGAGLYSTGTFAVGSWAERGNNFNTGDGTITFKEGGVLTNFTAGGGVFYVDANGQPRYQNNNASGAVAGNHFIPVMVADSGTNGHPICYTTTTTHSSKIYIAAGTSCP